MQKHKLIETGDGSKSLYLADLDETYHSRHGAIQESMHVFIKNGLIPILSNKPSVNVLEVGFGTGLNALLSAMEILKSSQLEVKYHTIERFPIPVELVKDLDYSNGLGGDVEKINLSMHDAAWQKWVDILPNFSIFKDCIDIKEVKISNWADVVYFDAFGPKVQPEMWNRETLELMYNVLKKDGVFVTYCAQGEFKRTLKGLNFEVMSLPGPPGKREMTKAFKKG